jgi:hypothetical protein
MGGQVSRELLEDLCAKQPQEYAAFPAWFREPTPGLYGFGLPFKASQLRALANQSPNRRRMTLLVTLLAQPLRGGRNSNDGEWHDCDADLLSSQVPAIELIHLPVKDGDVPSMDQTCEFVRRARLEILRGGAVGVHCWMGRCRTSALLAAYVIAEEAAAGQHLASVSDVSRVVWPYVAVSGVALDDESAGAATMAFLEVLRRDGRAAVRAAYEAADREFLGQPHVEPEADAQQQQQEDHADDLEVASDSGASGFTGDTGPSATTGTTGGATGCRTATTNRSSRGSAAGSQDDLDGDRDSDISHDDADADGRDAGDAANAADAAADGLEEGHPSIHWTLP